MSDEQQIANLVYAVADYRDRGDWLAAARLFEHASFQTFYPARYPGVGQPPEKVATRPPGTHGRQQGVEEIAALFAKTSRVFDDGLPHTQYVTTNLIVDVDHDAGTATARSYYVIFQSVDDFPLQPIAAGRYHDSFVREDDGWRFAVRQIFADHSGDLSHHLAMDPISYGEQTGRGR
jgi:hypothetical protein